MSSSYLEFRTMDKVQKALYTIVRTLFILNAIPVCGPVM
jgi:hypothetical protein